MDSTKLLIDNYLSSVHDPDTRQAAALALGNLQLDSYVPLADTGLIDWADCIPESITAIWDNLSAESKIVAFTMAVSEADSRSLTAECMQGEDN